QPACVDVLGFGLVLLGHQPLAAVVELIELEGLLLRDGHGMAVLAVLRGQSRVLRLLQHGRGGPSGGSQSPYPGHRRDTLTLVDPALDLVTGRASMFGARSTRRESSAASR